MDRWINYSHGMELYPGINDGRRQNENGILFYVEYLTLKKRLNKLTDQDKKDFITIVENLRTRDANGDIVKGVFDRGQGESYLPIEPQTRMISRDNLLAIAAGSKMFNLNYHNEIAKFGLFHLWFIDNGQPHRPRIIYTKYHNGKKDTSFKMQPKDWFYWLFNSNNIIFKALSIPLFPIFLISHILTCFSKKESTSGKMMIWMLFMNRKELPFKIVWTVCNYLLTKKYGKKWISKISDIYFNQRMDNPIRVLARQL